MEKINTILDREPLSSDYINSKQDFTTVLAGVKKLKPPVWKSAWFYGAVGFASLTIALLGTVDFSTTPDNTNKQITASFSPVIQNNVVIPDKISQPTKGPKLSEIQKTTTQVIPRAVSDPKEEKYTSSDTPEPSNSVLTPIENSQEIVGKNEPIVKNSMPHIAGVFNGEIKFSDFCGPNGIEVNDELEISSFKIQYYNGRDSKEFHAQGNNIPDDICQDIYTYNLHQMVFITNIRARNKNTGKEFSLSSLNYIPTK
ncbi:MAG: hypothetical protein JKY09_00830 [Crocinitomicaceae bacterium]|nr:hypothetical protein [Crocinitomicaceae bacterium]